MDIRIDYDKIMEYEDIFKEYDDYLPLIIREIFYSDYVTHLRSIGKYDEVMSVCASKRPLTYPQRIKELTEWLKENKEYSNIITKME